jgi:putative MATE family efflux protein
MKIHLYDHFTYKKLLRFVFPSIVMMLFTSIYGVVDGIFVANFCENPNAFPAVNIVMPFLMVVSGIGFMLGTGGSAIVAKTLGEGDPKKANRIFSMLVLVTAVTGIIISTVGIIFLEPISVWLGATAEMLPLCVEYGRIILIGNTAFMLQNLFQSFFVTAEKPGIGLAVTVLAGVANMVLDFVFIYLFKWEVAGAAWATTISQFTGGFIPLVYFAFPNSSLLRFAKPSKNMRYLLHACANGSSELMTNLSLSLVAMIYNWVLLAKLGQDGVSAYGAIMYTSFIFVAIFIGYSIGSAPIVSYHYGAKNHGELHSLLKKSLKIIAIFSISIVVISEALAYPLALLFGNKTPELLSLTYHAFALSSISYILAGFNIFSSAFFTALGNGPVSATISFVRLLLFQIVSILILPLIIGNDGIWLSKLSTEILSLSVCIFFLLKLRKKYNY